MDREYAEREEKLKAMESQLAQAGPGLGGTIGGAATQGHEIKRETLTGRLRDRMSRAKQESRKAEELAELLYLLDKNPELARILDLVESVGSY